MEVHVPYNATQEVKCTTGVGPWPRAYQSSICSNPACSAHCQWQCVRSAAEWHFKACRGYVLSCAGAWPGGLAGNLVNAVSVLQWCSVAWHPILLHMLTRRFPAGSAADLYHLPFTWGGGGRQQNVELLQHFLTPCNQGGLVHSHFADSLGRQLASRWQWFCTGGPDSWPPGQCHHHNHSSVDNSAGAAVDMLMCNYTVPSSPFGQLYCSGGEFQQ